MPNSLHILGEGLVLANSARCDGPPKIHQTSSAPQQVQFLLKKDITSAYREKVISCIITYQSRLVGLKKTRSSLKFGMHFSPLLSSGQGESHGTSPDARLTKPPSDDNTKTNTVSPSSVLNHLSEYNIKGHNKSGQLAADEQREAEKDPFVTPGRPSKSGLSPMASTFSPFPLLTDTIHYSRSPLNTLSHEMGMSRLIKVLSDDLVTVQDMDTWLQVRAIHLNSKQYE